ncbi:thioredoxin-like protein [Phlyctochytrium arcticum]|nr:thioredoxin-like protein [Phlyctochytrium arcticum]
MSFTPLLRPLLRSVRPAVRPALSLPLRSFASSSLVAQDFARVARPAPEFKGQAVVNNEFKDISLTDYKGKWVVLFFYPLDFTFVCPTEIIAFSERSAEFEALGAQVIGASVDSVHSHLAWIKLPRREGGLGEMKIPLLSDITKEISYDYGVLLEEKGFALRGTFIIDPKGIVRQLSVNDAPIGRSVDETLRLLESLQFADAHGEVCPANWKKGAKTINPAKSGDYFKAVNQ